MPSAGRMRERDRFRNFMVGVGILTVGLLILWIIFYILTVRMIKQNMRLQAQTGSEAIISAVEEELLTLENAAYDLAHNTGIAAIAMADTPLAFYDAGSAFTDENPVLPGNIRGDDCAVVYSVNGHFYRLRGTISNTTLGHCFWQMEGLEKRTLTVTVGSSTYIGSWERITAEDRPVGYVVLFTDLDRIERILDTYRDLDYLGAALLVGDRILCSNRNVRAEEITTLGDRAVFLREREIGVSGYRLLTWCESGISGQFTGYFLFVIPVTLLILVIVIALERKLYTTQLLVKESELEKERTLLSLLKKQISAHFTVNTLNVVRAMINKGEKKEAAHICSELSTLLRYANAGDEYISLLEEFHVLEQYIGIMQARYPGRIEAEIEIEDSFDRVFLPRMLLQPVVENAILHGLNGGKGRITVSAEVDTDRITVCVRDDGQGMSGEELAALREELLEDTTADGQDIRHVALKNIQRRIHMVCGEEYGITIESVRDAGTEVRITLPGGKIPL